MGNDVMKVVDIKKVVPSKTNPRKAFDKVALEELQASIEKHGILQPIIVREVVDKKSKTCVLEIVCGERRYRAAVALGLKQVPVKVVDMSDGTAAEVQVVENLQRAGVHPLEEAEGYERLIKDHGHFNAEGIAKVVGKSKAYIYKRMRLLSLVKECRKMFYDGKLNEALALLIARMPEDVQVKAAKEVVEDNMSVDSAREYIQRDFMLNLKDMPFAKNDKICPERGSCTTCPKRTKNDTLLFDDIGKDDQCTDAECFNAKRQAVIDLATEKAKSAGRIVADREKVFPYGSYVSGGYAGMSDNCYEDDDKRTYKELIKGLKDFQPSVAVTSNGVAVDVVNVKDVVKRLKEAGIISKAKKEDKKDDTCLINELVYRNAVPLILNKFGNDMDDRAWKFVAEMIIDNDEGQRNQLVASRVNNNAKPSGNANEFLKTYLNQIDPSEIPSFVMELLVTPTWGGFYTIDDKLVKAINFFGIELKGLVTTATAEVKANKKGAK